MDSLTHAQAQALQPPGFQPIITESPKPLNQNLGVQAPPDENKTASSKVRRGGKPAKVKAGPNHFRPGSSLTEINPAVPVKEKTLVFLIPGDGTVEEFQHVYGVARQFAAFPLLGEVTSISIQDKHWEITLMLAIPEGMDDDTALSEVFRTLMPTINASPELCNGFRVGTSSKWQFRVGSFIADKGGF